jgi:hypothetical protein
MFTFYTLIQHSLGIPSQSNKTGRRNKRTQIGKEVVKLVLFADSTILYLKELKSFSIKLLDTINSFSKKAGHKINLQKSVAFLIPPMRRLRKNTGK